MIQVCYLPTLQHDDHNFLVFSFDEFEYYFSFAISIHNCCHCDEFQFWTFCSSSFISRIRREFLSVSSRAQIELVIFSFRDTVVSFRLQGLASFAASLRSCALVRIILSLSLIYYFLFLSCFCSIRILIIWELLRNILLKFYWNFFPLSWFVFSGKLFWIMCENERRNIDKIFSVGICKYFINIYLKINGYLFFNQWRSWM